MVDNEDREGEKALLPPRCFLRSELRELEEIVPPLSRSVRAGQVNLVESILRAEEGSVHQKDAAFQTCLHFATRKEIVRLCLDHGAELNAKDFMGSTPLHNAVRKNLLDVVKELISRKCFLDPSDCEMQTPLHLAVKLGHLKMVSELLAAGADATILNSHLLTPLQLAFEMNDIAAVEIFLQTLYNTSS